jgi:hypothetical protein
VDASFDHGEDAVAAFGEKASEERASARASATSGVTSSVAQNTSGAGRLGGNDIRSDLREGSVPSSNAVSAESCAQKRGRHARHGSAPAAVVCLEEATVAPAAKRRQGTLDQLVVIREKPVSR